MRNVYVPSKVEGFTGVRAVEREPNKYPFTVRAPDCQAIGRASTRATAEAIARGHRIDQRALGVKAKICITERRSPGGFAYIAV